MLIAIRKCDLWLASVPRMKGLAATEILAGLTAEGEIIGMMRGIS
jgi:hypothetical protein